MTLPPTHQLHELGPQAQAMSRNCGNDKMAMILQYVALGSMIVMAGVAIVAATVVIAFQRAHARADAAALRLE